MAIQYSNTPDAARKRAEELLRKKPMAERVNPYKNYAKKSMEDLPIRVSVVTPNEKGMRIEKIPQKILEKPVQPEGGSGRELISIRLPKNILDYFRDKGPGYQARIVAVLEAHVSEKK